jgi:DNA adenine methylase
MILPQTLFPLVDEPIPKAKPFLKWAGGKSQLIRQIETYLPPSLLQGTISKYAEPFIGGGAVFFFMAEHFQLREFFISDMNKDLILAYKTVQADVEALIELLSEIQHDYFQLSPEKQKTYFYDLRTDFNQYDGEINFSQVTRDDVFHVAQLIFLNRTCYNGLYRVNAKGEFNVPYGKYKNPKICDAANLRNVSQLLAKTDIHYGDFTACSRFVDYQTFIYFDPPYRPISKTASFNSYSTKRFDDDEQVRLAAFCRQLNDVGAKILLSNSDPHNQNSQDDFFQEIYAGFTIRKVVAKRAINSNGAKRGEITELLVSNY